MNPSLLLFDTLVRYILILNTLVTPYSTRLSIVTDVSIPEYQTLSVESQ